MPVLYRGAAGCPRLKGSPVTARWHRRRGRPSLQSLPQHFGRDGFQCHRGVTRLIEHTSCDNRDAGTMVSYQDVCPSSAILWSFDIVRPARCFALCRSMLPEHTAHPSLRHRHHAWDVIDTAPPPCRAQKFPRAAPCGMSELSVRFDTALCNRAFSFSSSFIRRS